MAVAVSKKGIKFGNPSGKLTRIFFFMTIPTAASAFYLRLLSGLTQTFREKDNRDKLLQAKDSAEMWKVLTKLTRTTIK